MLSHRLITFYPTLILAVLLAGASVAWSQTPTPEVVAEKPSVLSFLEWKSMRVHEAQKKLEQVNKTDEQKLSFNVDVALQLTVQDYFSMYLKNLSPEEFKEAVKKLVPDESAELLMAYRNSLEKDKKVPLKFSKSPKDNATQKLPEI